MLIDPTRRDVIKSALSAGAAGGLALSGLAGVGAWAAGAEPAGPALPPAPRRRSLRLAHLTDFHIQPERAAFEGVAMCLAHVRNLQDPPALILTGGDLIMDSFDQGHDRTQALWNLWTRTLKDHNALPVEHCLGNHDIWGWNKKKSGTRGDEAKWGKRWALDTLGLDKPYRTFDRAGWRFVVLDSVFPQGDGYVGRLDDEQHDWLASTLKFTPAATPILILSHIPIITVTAFCKTKEDVVGRHEVPAGEMHADAKRLVALFARYPNVKACLSGHIHETDRVEYQGVTYLCDGAVSGAWWKGRHHACDEGYALVDLYDDGSVERGYEAYGWKARE